MKSTVPSEGNRTSLDEFVQGITAAPSTTWTASVKVNSDTGTTVQDHPSIALGNETPAPATYLIWDDARNGNADIYFSKRDPSTGLWGTNGQPAAHFDSSSSWIPQLLPYAKGGQSDLFRCPEDANPERNQTSVTVPGSETPFPVSYGPNRMFVNPAAYAYGNTPLTGVFGLRAPHAFNEDLSLKRNFKVKERINLRVQWDAFNAFNNVRFGGPNINTTSAAFGKITSQANSPRLMQISTRVEF